MGQNPIINDENIVGLVQRTLNEVDPRLVDHGIRVSYLVSRMLEIDGSFSKEQQKDICLLCVLHDIGAYKTEEIDRLVQFETNDVWEHSIYGYLFLMHLSPLKEWAQAVLYHHVPYKDLPDLEPRLFMAAQMLSLADRMEIYYETYQEGRTARQLGREAVSYLEKKRNSMFSDEVIDLFIEAERKFSLFARLRENPIPFNEVVPQIAFSEEECTQYLQMMIYAIDFRSQHTVTHTITTASISVCAARYMGIPGERIKRIYFGAMLHDLGKIGIPVEILEYPGKLSAQAMAVMRTHVNITEKILGGSVAPDVAKIALRHHEKMDGSGYPLGLTGNETTLEEQILAVSDIISALLGTRSYKEAFSKDRTLSIIGEMAVDGKLNPEIVWVIQENFEKIVDEVADNCAPVLENYYGIQSEYRRLLVKYL